VTSVQYRFESPNNFKTFHIEQKVTAAQVPYTNTRPYPRRRHRYRQQEPPSSTDPALLRRKYIYRHKLYSLHVGSNRVSQHKSFTPHTFAQSPELQSRARKWIRRELAVFDFLKPDHPSTLGNNRATNTEYLLEFIIAILKAVDIKDSSGQAEELVKEFIGRDNAQLFLHELEAWLRSPHQELGDWDCEVQYREGHPLMLIDEEAICGETRSKAIQPGHARHAVGRHSKCDRRWHTMHGQNTSTGLSDTGVRCVRNSMDDADELREAKERFEEFFLLDSSLTDE
jgi:hypothetical protein